MAHDIYDPLLYLQRHASKQQAGRKAPKVEAILRLLRKAKERDSKVNASLAA